MTSIVPPLLVRRYKPLTRPPEAFATTGAEAGINPLKPSRAPPRHGKLC